MPSTYRNVARVVRPHGKHGEVAVSPVRGLPFLLYSGMSVALTPPALDRDRFCTVAEVREGTRDWLVSFSGIDSIDAAEGVTGCMVLAHADDLELDQFDASWDSLVGRSVIDARFGRLGEVTGVLETPANDVLEVAGRFGEVLIPIIEQALDELPETGDIHTHIMDGLIGEAALARVRAEGGEGDSSC